MSPKRPQDKSAEEKLKIVMEAETVAVDQLGAFLRRNGIHEAQLKVPSNIARSEESIDSTV